MERKRKINVPVFKKKSEYCRESEYVSIRPPISSQDCMHRKDNRIVQKDRSSEEWSKDVNDLCFTINCEDTSLSAISTGQETWTQAPLLSDENVPSFGFLPGPYSNKMTQRKAISTMRKILYTYRAKSGMENSLNVNKITDLAVEFQGTLKNEFLQFIYADLPKYSQIALAWMYKEYYRYEGFELSLASPSNETDQFIEYDTYLSELLNQLRKQPDQIGHFRNLTLNAPVMSSKVLSVLKEYFANYMKVDLTLLKKLILKRPDMKFEGLNILQELTVHDKFMVRHAAIEIAVQLYKIIDFRGHIEEKFPLARHHLNFLLNDSDRRNKTAEPSPKLGAALSKTFVHCKDKSAIKLLSCSDEESTNDVPSSSASKKSKLKKSVDANNQRRTQQKKQNNVGHTKQSDDVVRSSLSSPKKTDPLQSPKLTSADTHESNLSESEKENNITTNMVGAGANVGLFPMLSPRVSILPVMSPHANMPRLLTLNNDNDATRSWSPASSSGTLNENSRDSRSAFIVECKEPIVVTPLEYDDSIFDDKDLNHRSLKRPGEQLEEPSKRLTWNSEDIIDKISSNGALNEMQCETETKMISLPVSCKPYQNSLNEILAVDGLVKKESKEVIICSETSQDGSHSTIHSSAAVEVCSSANVPCSVDSNKGPFHDWNGDHYNSEKFNKNKMEIKMECELNQSKALTPDVVLIFDSESESQYGMKPISIRADTVTPRSDHNSPRFSSISSKRSSADVIVLPSSQPSKVHVIDDKPVRRVRLSAYGRDLSPDTVLHGCARTDIKLKSRTPVATTHKSHHKEYSQKSSSRPLMPELIPTSAATISSSQPSFSKSSFVDALPPFRPPSFHSHRSHPPPGLLLPMPTMAPQSGMGSLHQPMVMPPMPGWGQFEMLAAQLAANQEMLRVQQGLNKRFLQDGRLGPMPILGGHLGLNGLPLGLPGMPTLTLRTEMHQHQHLHHHQHVVPAYIPPSNPMPVMQPTSKKTASNKLEKQINNGEVMDFEDVFRN